MGIAGVIPLGRVFTASHIIRQGQDGGFLHIDELEAEALC